MAFLPVLSHRVRAGLRGRVLPIVLAAVAMLAVPATAHAALPASCRPGSQQIITSSGSTGQEVKLLLPATANITFECIVGIGYEGPNSAATGPVLTAIRNLMPLARTIVFGVFILELIWVGLFGADKAWEGMLSACVKLILAVLCLQMYDPIVRAFRTMAVQGQQYAVRIVAAAPVTGGQVATNAAQATRSAVREQIRAQAAEYYQLDDMKGRGTLDAVQERRYRELGELMDVTRCKQTVTATISRGGSRDEIDAYQTACDEVAKQSEAVRQARRSLLGVLGDMVVSGVEAVQAFFAKPMIMVLTTGIEFLLSACLLAINGLIALAFLMTVAIGPLCIAFLPWRHSAKAGNWWFKNMIGTTLLPVLLGGAVGLYYGTADWLVKEASATSPFVMTVGYFMLMPMTIMAATGAWRLSQSFGGTMLAAGMEMGKVASATGFAVATGGVGAYAAARRNGSGVLDSLGSAMGTGLRDSMSQGIAGAGAFAGQAAPGADGRPDGRAASAAAHVDRLAQKGIGAAKAGVGRGADAMRGAVGGDAGGFSAPSGAVSALERSYAEGSAGADLAAHLQAGRDYTAGPDGALALTGQGRQAVGDYRKANRGQLRAMASLDDDGFVNAPGVASRITGAHGGQTSFQSGSADEAIAEALPNAVTAPRPGETPQMTAGRVQSVVGEIARRSGGNWNRAASMVSDMNRAAARTAVGSDNQSYGIMSDDVSPSVPSSQRRYVAELGSAFEQLQQASPGRPAETVYRVCRDEARKQIPQDAGESDDVYEQRIHQAVFTRQVTA